MSLLYDEGSVEYFKEFLLSKNLGSVALERFFVGVMAGVLAGSGRQSADEILCRSRNLMQAYNEIVGKHRLGVMNRFN